jgi:hypothetical protein
LPVTYTIERERRLVLSVASGVVTAEEFLEHGKRLGEDPDFEPSFDQILDLRAATPIELPTAALKGMASLRLFGAGSRRALVAPRDLVFGLARMYESLRADAPESLRSFRTIEEARRWLGLE